MRVPQGEPAEERSLTVVAKRYDGAAWVQEGPEIGSRADLAVRYPEVDVVADATTGLITLYLKGAPASQPTEPAAEPPSGPLGTDV